MCSSIEYNGFSKKHVLSRIIEMDFMSRFLVTKTFLKSDNKEYFYNQFSKWKILYPKRAMTLNHCLL